MNGVSFSGSGTFTTTGVQDVTLQATGTPTASGNTTYQVSFGSSSCSFQINYLAAGPASVGTLGSTAGACAPITPAGTYTQGTALTASNTVTVQANVTTAGSYRIYTDTVNGVSFSLSGTYAAGTQTAVLVGSGTPAAAGSHTFTVKYGTSTCTFSITFGAGTTPPPSSDYFILTPNSNWVYYGTTGNWFLDSNQVTVTALTTPFGGNTYKRFHDTELGFGTVDTFYYRKSGTDYVELQDIEYYFGFDAPQWAEVTFLKESAAVGATWTSQTFSGTVGGMAATASYKFTVVAKGVSATVGSLSFPDVIKIKTDVFYSFTGTTPVVTYERWYAKGIGLIYDNVTGQDEQKIQRYQIF